MNFNFKFNLTLIYNGALFLFSITLASVMYDSSVESVSVVNLSLLHDKKMACLIPEGVRSVENYQVLPSKLPYF